MSRSWLKTVFVLAGEENREFSLAGTVEPSYGPEAGGETTPQKNSFCIGRGGGLFANHPTMRRVARDAT